MLSGELTWKPWNEMGLQRELNKRGYSRHLRPARFVISCQLSGIELA